jgi:hypothetical protein
MACLPATPAGAAHFLSRTRRELRGSDSRDWNTRDGGAGYVLRFEVETDYLAQYPVQTVGARVHREYWIPAKDLDEFNQHIVGPIEVLREFRLAT